LDSHPDAETSEYERQQKDIESAFNPIMARVYQAAGGQPGGAGPGGFPGGFPGGAGGPGGATGGNKGPTVD